MNEKGGTSWWHLFLSNAFKIQSVSFIFSPANPMLCTHFVNISQAKRLWLGLLRDQRCSEKFGPLNEFMRWRQQWLLWRHAEDTRGCGSHESFLQKARMQTLSHMASGSCTLRGPSLSSGTCPTGSGEKASFSWMFCFHLNLLYVAKRWEAASKSFPFPSILTCLSPAPLPPPPPLYNTHRHTHSYTHSHVHSHVHSSLHTSLNSHFTPRPVLGRALLDSAKQWFEGQGKRKRRETSFQPKLSFSSGLK